jgi:hypothetical protein
MFDKPAKSRFGESDFLPDHRVRSSIAFTGKMTSVRHAEPPAASGERIRIRVKTDGVGRKSAR